MPGGGGPSRRALAIIGGVLAGEDALDFLAQADFEYTIEESEEDCDGDEDECRVYDVSSTWTADEEPPEGFAEDFQERDGEWVSEEDDSLTVVNEDGDWRVDESLTE